jgi:hypothetical protein
VEWESSSLAKMHQNVSHAVPLVPSHWLASNALANQRPAVEGPNGESMMDHVPLASVVSRVLLVCCVVLW